MFYGKYVSCLPGILHIQLCRKAVVSHQLMIKTLRDHVVWLRFTYTPIVFEYKINVIILHRNQQLFFRRDSIDSLTFKSHFIA